MEEAPEKGKELSHSAHANEMAEMSFCHIYIKNKFLSLLGRQRSARSKHNIYI